MHNGFLHNGCLDWEIWGPGIVGRKGGQKEKGSLEKMKILAEGKILEIGEDTGDQQTG